MNSQVLIYVLGMLVCSLSMGLLMWLMMRQQDAPAGKPLTGSASERLEQLKARRQELDLEITEAGRAAELESGQPRP